MASDNLGNPLTQGKPLFTSCRKELCLGEVYNNPTKSFDIEKIFLGSPSGRQECENLKI